MSIPFKEKTSRARPYGLADAKHEQDVSHRFFQFQFVHHLQHHPSHTLPLLPAVAHAGSSLRGRQGGGYRACSCEGAGRCGVLARFHGIVGAYLAGNKSSRKEKKNDFKISYRNSIPVRILYFFHVMQGATLGPRISSRLRLNEWKLLRKKM